MLILAFVSHLQAEDDEQIEQEYEDDFEVTPHLGKPAVACSFFFGGMCSLVLVLCLHALIPLRKW